MDKTVQYKRTLRGSVGAGMGSLFNGNGRRYFILEHRDSSKYHKAGESQKIIIDQVELGRDGNCQVQFDENFPTVSRRHAAIIRDGERWKLVQLSKTNSTLLNGQKVDNEWYLENGDEIQLSVGGPRMGFIVPQGKQSLVSSIKMTERLELFRKQALKPYKTAIACLAVLLVLAVGGLGAWNLTMKQSFDQQIAEAREKLTKIIGKNAELDSLLIAAQQEQVRQDSIINEMKKHPKVVYKGTDEILGKMLKKVEDDIFFIKTTKVVITDGVEEIELPDVGWIATGFLCSDGRFITAKHCVEGWKFDKPDYKSLLTIGLALADRDLKVVAYLEAKSNNRVLHFKSTDFTMNHGTEHTTYIDEDCAWVTESSWQSDWAYVQTNEKGTIVADPQLSRSLPMGAELHILGFPHGWGAVDTRNFSCLYGSCRTAKEGLDDGIIKVSARNYEPGNSGGPALYYDHGVLKAVGIVSHHRMQSDNTASSHGGLCAIANLY